jgi:hypothetical protein
VSWIKAICLFKIQPSAEDLGTLTALESRVISETKALLPRSFPAKNLPYEVVANAMNFLPAYCGLSDLFVQYGYPTFAAVPLRRSRVQSYVRIDTTILCEHVLHISKRRAGSLTPERKRELWSQVLDLKDKVFREKKGLGLTFDGSITTNGHAVNVHFKKPGIKYGFKRSKKSKEKLRQELKASYVEENLGVLKENPNIVVIDPNRRDLLYCRGLQEGKTFRYTSNQRAKECGYRLFQKKIKELKREHGVVTLESQIPTHRPLDRGQFEHYLRCTTDASPQLNAFYGKRFHAWARFRTYSRKQSSEARMVNNMKKTFGKDISIVLGDWSGGNAKYHQPSKVKGWRTTFRRHGLRCFLLDEFRTSALCPCCEERVVSGFKERPHSRPYRRAQGRFEWVHGLLGCTNLHCKEQAWTYRYFNRDAASTSNMVKIVQSLLQGMGRPERFRRGDPQLA